jgi:bifunctional aspartokinase / homoserine dehydrogenase 1
MKVLKFGGTSVASAEAIRQVIAIVQKTLRKDRVVVVVSALGGVTNQLLAAAEAAAGREPKHETIWTELKSRHFEAARALVGSLDHPVMATLAGMFDELHEMLRGVFLLREASARARDGIASYGERLSAEIVAAAFGANGTAARVCDTRATVLTDERFGRAQVDLERSYANLRRDLEGDRHAAAESDARLPIITGFIGATAEGHTTTLGRGGSDYTAALVGAALQADAIEIWTDVDGVLTADPRTVATAFSQPEMSYAELMELSHFGAKVIYPPTVLPARQLGIPLWIKNTFNPDHPGTVVLAEAKTATEGPQAAIRGISSIKKIALARLEGDGMVGVPGIAERLFGALARTGVSVILISQSSSEHSICFAVAPEDGARARQVIDGEFALERRLGLVNDLILEPDQAVVAAVGEAMAHRPGIAGQVFGVLGRHGVNVRAIAQGSSELNISLVVASAEEARAVRAIHSAFFEPGKRRLDIAVVGPGKVGAALLEQIAEAKPHLAQEGLELRVIAVANSRSMVLDAQGIPPEAWRERFEGSGLPSHPQQLLNFLAERRGAATALADCSADGNFGAWYQPLLEANIAIAAANKKPFAGSLNRWHQIRSAGRTTCLGFEATVGAGLPVVGTLENLVRTGDRIQRIDGVLSGTCNAVLDRLAGGEDFSSALRAAFDLGLTEPHPYDDLAGEDVRRKLVILARLAGFELEPDQVEVEPILPISPWSELSLEEFWTRLPEVDSAFTTRRAAAAAQGCRLRYLASVSAAGAKVALVPVATGHPAYDLAGPDNLVAIRTHRYASSPLVVRGPGAGPAVTATAVFANLLDALGGHQR